MTGLDAADWTPVPAAPAGATGVKITDAERSTESAMRAATDRWDR